jgi:hypothetical protein
MGEPVMDKGSIIALNGVVRRYRYYGSRAKSYRKI